MEVAGFVLTGGLSARMGADKALLAAGSQTLCERIGDAVGEVAETVFLVGHPERYGHLKYKCLADIRPGFGPLSGLETALSHGKINLHVVASCDVYNLNVDWLKELISIARNTASLCAAARDSTGKIQPLCAVYRKECLPIVSRAISERRLRATDLLKELNATTIDITGTVINLNTPEEYSQIVNPNGRT